MSTPTEEFLRLPATSKISLHVRNGQFDEQPDGKRFKGWRASPELPLPKELMANEPSPLLVNPIDIPPRSKVEYLETHHRMYRCEGVEPLRQAISEFRESPEMMEGEKAFIYTQVHIQGYLLTALDASCRLAFSTERSPIKVIWRQSERLTPGTLIALSPRSDMFRTQCLVATVTARPLIGGLVPDVEAGEDDNTPPRVDISWADNGNAPIDPTVEMVMLEAKSGYFENVRYAMLGLQHAALYESRLDKYIVGAPSEIEHATANYLGELRGQTVVVPDAARHCDASQLEAFQSMTTSELSIVQGPPGTGKTFTSIVAIQSFVETLQKCDNRIPIVIAAQTNHALDQLLQLCLQQEVGKIVRLGGRSCSPAIDQYSMFNLRQGSKAKRGNVGEEKKRQRLCQRLQESFNLCFQDGLISAEDLQSRDLITQEQYESLTSNEWESADDDPEDASDGAVATWLDNCVQEEPVHVYQPPQGQDEPAGSSEPNADQDYAADHEERYRLKGLFIPIKPKRTGSVPGSLRQDGAWWHQAKRHLAGKSDLYEIKPAERGMVYRYLRSKIMEQVAVDIQKLLLEYKKVCDTLRVSRWDNSVKVLQFEGIHIIGCTTTGLTKYRGLLAAVMPRIMLIEEAAETREANITSALFPSLEQLVLVGDHQQLTPHVDVRHLGALPYNLNVSLFERLVKLKMPYTTLRVQRRMIPAIRKVVQTFYPMLEDHQIVTEARHRPPVPGMGGINLWWFQHQWPESRNSTFSCMNWTEAEMIVGFVKYLVQNGLGPNQITILTYYNAQLDLIRQLLRGDKLLGRIDTEWSIRTVDGFQGEENDVILLSLVRSPEKSYGHAKAGFVQDENRAVVATSRARRGLYIFGNARNLLASSNKSSQTWQKVYSAFGEQTGYGLPVTCKSHGNVTELRNPDGWGLEGGCQKPCGKKCLNGHQCSAPCHAADQEHRNTCKEACSKVLSCGHSCARQCRDECRCAERCSTAISPPVKTWTNRPARRPAASEVSSQLSNSGTSTPPTGPPSEGSGHLTSEDLIAMGFLNCVAAGAGALPRETAEPCIDTQQLAQLSLRALRTPSPKTLPEKWSAETIKQKETQLRQDLDHDMRREGGRSSPTATSSVRNVYHPTTINATGRRVAGSPTPKPKVKPKVTVTVTDMLIDFSENNEEHCENKGPVVSQFEEDLIQLD